MVAPGARDEDATVEQGVAPSPQAQAPGPSQVGKARVVRIGGPALPYDRTYHLFARPDKVGVHIAAESPEVVEAHSPYLAALAVVLAGAPDRWLRTAFWHADHVGTYVEPAVRRYLGPGAAAAVTAPLWQVVRGLLSPFAATFVAGRAQAARLRSAGVQGVVHAPMGVDVATFRPSARSDERRRELIDGHGADAALLVGVGRFAFEKRWDVVLDAFARLRARRDAVLVLFGDGPERASLERSAPPGVRFVGFEKRRDRLASALASADVLVHGCPFETFGLGVAEAVASGLPVVVPDAGGAVEGMDPSCGEAYRSLDAEACAEALVRILSSDPQALRDRARQASTRVPTMARHLATVLSTYEALLRERRS